MKVEEIKVKGMIITAAKRGWWPLIKRAYAKRYPIKITRGDKEVTL